MSDTYFQLSHIVLAFWISTPVTKAHHGVSLKVLPIEVEGQAWRCLSFLVTCLTVGTYEVQGFWVPYSPGTYS